MKSWQFSPRKQTSHTLLGATKASPAPVVCLRIVDAGIFAILFIAPLFFGGRHPLGRFVLVSLCVAVAVAWFFRLAILGRGTWTHTAAYGVLVAAIAVVGFQLVPLPQEWINSLSPRIASLLPLWAKDSPNSPQFGLWQTLSMTPDSTRIALATLVAYGLLFVTVVQRLKKMEDVERVLCWIALSAIFMGGFGLLQYFTSNGRFFWFYELPFSDTNGHVKGSFSCRNHFAHFLALGVGPLIAWIVSRQSSQDLAPDHRPRTSFARPALTMSSSVAIVLAFGLAMVVFAVLFSLSRGGVMALSVASLVATIIYYRSGLITTQHLLGAVGLVVIVVAVLSFQGGYEQVVGRIDDFTSGSLDELDNAHGRRKIWAANVEAIRAGWLTGSGAGSHRYIYPIYLPESQLTEYTDAENGPLQIVTENGLPGALLLLAGMTLCGAWCWRALRAAPSTRNYLWATAVTAALSASIVHSLVDFVWFIPACMSVTILLAACALRLAQLTVVDQQREHGNVPIARFRWIGLATAVSLAGAWAISSLAGPAFASLHWDRYLLADNAKQEMRQHQLAHPDEDQAMVEESEALLNESMIASLRDVVRLHPQFARAHLRLAGKYLKQFDQKQRHAENNMSVAQIRDAAMSSGFSSAEELRKWLLLAFGKNCDLLYQAHYHARRAARLGPLQGEVFLYLANLCFLEGRGLEDIDAYVNQALRVRPYDGDVLFSVGMQRLLLGQLDEALHHWINAFRDKGKHQHQIIRILAGQIPAVTFLETFEPDWRTLSYLWSRYREVGQLEDLQALAKYAAAVTVRETPQLNPSRSAHAWLMLALMQRELQQSEEALASLRLALAANPNHFTIRRLLGQTLLKEGHAEEADLHLRWCLSRRPDNAAVEAELIQATKSRMRQAQGTSTLIHLQ